MKSSNATGRAVLISVMTNDKLFSDAVLGIKWIHQWCGCTVLDSKLVRFYSCAVVNEESDEMAADALAKIKTVFFEDPQRIPAHSKHHCEIVLREDIRIQNCRMPLLSTANRESLRKCVLSMLESGRIRESKYETVCLLLFVKKNDGGTRVCVD
jgi:hypothetical protein